MATQHMSQHETSRTITTQSPSIHRGASTSTLEHAKPDP
jgi:hypothetical protein